MNAVLSLGIILLGALAAEKVVRRINVPAITSYIVLGIILGPSLLDLAGEGVAGASDVMSHIVLGFIAFQIGSNFRAEDFRKIGAAVVSISLFETLLAWLMVTAGVWLLAGRPLHISLVYGAIAAATAPAATMMVIRQYRARGRFTDVLLGVVAIDDAWGIVAFSVSIFLALSIHGGADPAAGEIMGMMARDIFLALAVGAGAAYAVKYAGRYVRRRGDTLTFVLGALLASTGVAIYLESSHLLANIFFGAVLVNIDSTAFRYFDFIKTVDWPLYIIFYVLVGVNLEIHLLAGLGLLAGVYIVFRAFGKMAGAYLGALAAGLESPVRRYMGLALMPQAGVALGLALMAKDRFPGVGDELFAAITATTIIYELAGPLAAKLALSGAGDIPGRAKAGT